MTLEAVHALVEAAGLPAHAVTASAVARMAAYFERRAHWARVHNLSGPATLQDPWATDGLDALAVHACLDPKTPLVDVGTGNGVPGFLLACLDPARTVVLVEPRLKRVAFLRSAAGQLGLGNIRLHRGRWPIPLGHAFQIISRAVVSPTAWPSLATAGDPPTAVLRMLAEERPAFGLSGWALSGAVDYTGQGRSLRIERWSPANP